jgi:hypothetical protein
MKKAISAKQKSRGRPATGITPMMGFRADPVIRAEIVRWAENQPDMPSLSEAIRRLVELGLTVKTKSAPSERQRAALADLAAKAIDSLTVAAPDDEKASRKRRLLKGPTEFREARVDQPKAKGK